MKTYDDNRRCPKCNQVATTRHKKHHLYGSCMERECLRCGYVWHEKPLDAGGEDGPQFPRDGVTVRYLSSGGYRLTPPLASTMYLFGEGKR